MMSQQQLVRASPPKSSRLSGAHTGPTKTRRSPKKPIRSIFGLTFVSPDSSKLVYHVLLAALLCGSALASASGNEIDTIDVNPYFTKALPQEIVDEFPCFFKHKDIKTRIEFNTGKKDAERSDPTPSLPFFDPTFRLNKEARHQIHPFTGEKMSGCGAGIFAEGRTVWTNKNCFMGDGFLIKKFYGDQGKNWRKELGVDTPDPLKRDFQYHLYEKTFKATRTYARALTRYLKDDPTAIRNSCTFMLDGAGADYYAVGLVVILNGRHYELFYRFSDKSETKAGTYHAFSKRLITKDVPTQIFRTQHDGTPDGIKSAVESPLGIRVPDWDGKRWKAQTVTVGDDFSVTFDIEATGQKNEIKLEQWLPIGKRGFQQAMANQRKNPQGVDGVYFVTLSSPMWPCLQILITPPPESTSEREYTRDEKPVGGTRPSHKLQKHVRQQTKTRRRLVSLKGLAYAHAAFKRRTERRQ